MMNALMLLATFDVTCAHDNSAYCPHQLNLSPSAFKNRMIGALTILKLCVIKGCMILAVMRCNVRNQIETDRVFINNVFTR